MTAYDSLIVAAGAGRISGTITSEWASRDEEHR